MLILISTCKIDFKLQDGGGGGGGGGCNYLVVMHVGLW